MIGIRKDNEDKGYCHGDMYIFENDNKLQS